jgi:hypothetical protein
MPEIRNPKSAIRNSLDLDVLAALRRAGFDRRAAAGQSEEGGLEEFVESFFRPASCRSRSAIRFSDSVTLML